VYALFWPERADSTFGHIDWSRLKQLTFDPPDYQRFPALKLAFEVAARGGTAPAVYNAANETAVAVFLDRGIRFTDIADTIRRTVDSVDIVDRPQLEDILEADHKARRTARQIMEKTTC
jgi:1-deoxy-D-xylulose-5-phosphate reductoisomerase